MTVNQDETVEQAWSLRDSDTGDQVAMLWLPRGRIPTVPDTRLWNGVVAVELNERCACSWCEDLIAQRARAQQQLHDRPSS